MTTCSNCRKNVNVEFEYCGNCGSRLDGESLGDFRTDIRNLFRDDGGYYYVYHVNGIQQVIRASSVEEVQAEVARRRFPWFNPSESSVKPQGKLSSRPKHKSLFLKASENHNRVISSSSSFRYSSAKTKSSSSSSLEGRFEEVKSSPTFAVPKPVSISETVKETPKRQRLVPDEELPRQFGIVGVYRDTHDGRERWAYKTNENPYPIYNDRLEGLKDDVVSREYGWEIVDDVSESQAYDLDRKQKEMRDAEILAKRREPHISIHEKRQIKRELDEKRQVSKNPEFENMDKFKW